MIRFVAILIAVSACAEDSAYRAAISQWRREKEAKLKADDGWLTVTGLFWLKQGENRVDSAPGVFELHGAKTVYRPDHGAPVAMKAETKVTDGPRTFSVIERGGKYAVRMKDSQSKRRAEFKGQRWY